MRGPRLAAGTAALMAAACLAGMASVASAAPARPAWPPPRRAAASARCRQARSTRQPSSARCAGSRRAPARWRRRRRRPRPSGPFASGSRSTTFNGILYRKDYTLRGVGAHIEVWVANDLAFPAGDCRTQVADVDADHGRADHPPDHRVRRQHVPEGDGDLQHAAGPGRHQRAARAGRQRQRRRLHRRRREDRGADRQRPGRQLLHVPGGADLHRRLLLLAVQRAASIATS